MWQSIDGKNMPKNIADNSGVSIMAVSDFLRQLCDTGLIKYEQGKPPKKLIQYTPLRWFDEIKNEK